MEKCLDKNKASLAIGAIPPLASTRASETVWPEAACEGRKPALGKKLGETTISPLTRDDLRDVIDIEFDSFLDPWTPLAFISDVEYNSHARYVVMYGGADELVGYAGWWLVGEKAFLLKIAISKNYRQQGFGTRLLEYALESMCEAGVSTVELEVRESNLAAQGLYESLGFNKVDTVLSRYQRPSENAMVFERLI